MMIFSRRFSEQRDSVLGIKNPPDIFRRMFGGVPTFSGVSVNEDNALSLTAVWGAVMKISRLMAIFSFGVYKHISNGGREKIAGHAITQLMQSKPNPRMTAFMWRQMTKAHELIYGAGISEIERDATGRPVALWPLPPWRVRPMETEKGELVYELTEDKGAIRRIWPENLLIFAFFPTLSGGWLSPIAVHREGIGSALAVREFGARTFSQGVNPAGIVSGIDWGDEEKEATLKETLAAYEGLGNAHRLMLLEEGMKFERVGLPPEDAQYLETRRFDIEEIARIYDVPAVLLHSTDKSSSWAASVEQLKEMFISFNMAPHCAHFEQEVNVKLLDEGKGEFCKLNMDGLLRGNLKDRMEAYVKALTNGVYSLNTINALEDRNPLPAEIGDVRFVPMNLQTLEDAVAGKNLKDEGV